MEYAYGEYETNNAYKPQDAHSSVETRASTKSPNSGADAEEYQLMDELVDAEALALSMPQPQLARLSTEEQAYGAYNMAPTDCGPGMMPSPTHGAPHGMVQMAPQSPMGQQADRMPYSMEMPSNMPMQMMPSNAPMMYTDMNMQQAGQVQMQWQAMQQGQAQQTHMMMPMMMPVRMVPVPVPMGQMQMGAQVPQQAGYYLVPDAAEQHLQQPQPQPQQQQPQQQPQQQLSAEAETP